MFVMKWMIGGCRLGRYMFVNLPIDSKYYHQQLPQKLKPALKLMVGEKKLNEKCYLLEHVGEILEKNPDLILQDEDKKILDQEIILWKGSKKGRFQKIATVIWAVQKLNLSHKYPQLLEQAAERIRNDEWYVNFDETVKAMEAFVHYPDSQLKQQLYEKIQRNVKITIWEVNMKYYERICESLLEAGRNRSPLWDKLQTHILSNLGMGYSVKTICSIFQSFALSRNGSEQFYQMIQYALYKGHYHRIDVPGRNILGEFRSNGEFFALLVQTFAIVKVNSNITLSEDFKHYIYKSLKNSQVEIAEASSLTKLIKYLPYMQFQEEQVRMIMDDIIKHKRVKQLNSLEELEELYRAVMYLYGELPLKLQENIQSIVEKQINRNTLSIFSSIQLTDFILHHHCTNTKENLIAATNTYLNDKYKYLPPHEAKAVLSLLNRPQSLPSESGIKLLNN